MANPKFVLFDIDGTLVNVQKGFMPVLIEQLLQRAGREEAVINGRSFAGRTDRDIFTQLLQDNELSTDHYDYFSQLYIDLLDEMLTPEQIDLLEGTRESIEFCIDQGHHVGLLTGNFRKSAFIKLNRVGLDHYFADGAFGGNEANRNLLPAMAYETGRRKNPALKPSDMIIIGDTPRDISCAKFFGCVSVGVSTGSYSRAQLEEHTPDLVVESLSDPETWVSRLAV